MVVLEILAVCIVPCGRDAISVESRNYKVAELIAEGRRIEALKAR